MNLVKGKAIPVTGLDRLWGFQVVDAPRFQDSRHMKVVSLSALRTGHLSPRKYPWNSFLLEAESTPGPWSNGRIISMKNSSDIIGNRNRDLLACIAVPQPTAPHRTPSEPCGCVKCVEWKTVVLSRGTVLYGVGYWEGSVYVTHYTVDDRVTR
jgi:hypothetical protein